MAIADSVANHAHLASLIWPLFVYTFLCVRGGFGGVVAVLPPFQLLFLFSLFGSVPLRPLEAVIRSKRHVPLLRLSKQS